MSRSLSVFCFFISRVIAMGVGQNSAIEGGAVSLREFISKI
jgi:hypothetical protein